MNWLWQPWRCATDTPCRRKPATRTTSTDSHSYNTFRILTSSSQEHTLPGWLWLMTGDGATLEPYFCPICDSSSRQSLLWHLLSTWMRFLRTASVTLPYVASLPMSLCRNQTCVTDLYSPLTITVFLLRLL